MFKHEDKINEFIKDEKLFAQELMEECDKYGYVIKTDDVGNIIYHRDNDGKITETEYNDRNLKIRETIRENKDDNNPKIINYTYNDEMQLIVINDNKNNSETKEYDKNGNVTYHKIIENNEIILEIKSKYNENNLLIFEENKNISTKFHYIDNDPFMYYMIRYDEETDFYEIEFNNYKNGYKKLILKHNGEKVWYFNGTEIQKEETISPIE